MQSMTFGRPLMLGSIVICPVPQMIDEEFLATDPATPDARQPHDTPAKTAYFVHVLQLSSITADTLQYVPNSLSPASVRVHLKLSIKSIWLKNFLREDCRIPLCKNHRRQISSLWVTVHFFESKRPWRAGTRNSPLFFVTIVPRNPQI